MLQTHFKPESSRNKSSLKLDRSVAWMLAILFATILVWGGVDMTRREQANAAIALQQTEEAVETTRSSSISRWVRPMSARSAAQGDDTSALADEEFEKMNGETQFTPEERAALEQEARERAESAGEAGARYGALNPSARPAIDFGALAAVNGDLAGWLRIEETAVDYPLVQGADNDHYLNHLFDGTANKSGAIFIDSRNDRNFEDQNTLIYGHHMRDGSMFASLVNYKEQAYYDEYPVMLLFTPGGNYLVEFFAGYTVPIRDEALPCFYMGSIKQ